MAKQWRMIRVEADVGRLLDEEVKHAYRIYTRYGRGLPCENGPPSLSLVIKQAIIDRQRKRERSARWRPRKHKEGGGDAPLFRGAPLPRAGDIPDGGDG